jgi:hypothetical protein
MAPHLPGKEGRKGTIGETKGYYQKARTLRIDTMRETDTAPISTIRLLQCNLHKSNATMLSILNSSSENFTALLLQEQRWSEWLKSSLIHDTSWTLIESTTKARQPPRSAIYVNKRILGSSFYEQVHLPFSDVTAIAIRTTDSKPRLVINIYNPPGRDSICKVRASQTVFSMFLAF